MKHSPGPLPLLLVQGLRDPQASLSWTLPQWDGIVRLGRRLRLLARLAAAVDAAGLLPNLPEPVRRHLIGELRLSAWRTQSMRWALQRIGQAIAGSGGSNPPPIVLLKGAAYVVQGLPVAAGRMPADLDILVPRDRLDEVLARLQQVGWRELELDAHDQRYYREWSHELPPMHHPTHPIELDLHHNILPPVARTKVDAELLLQHLRPTAMAPWCTLQPVDQVLHSAAHLFLDSEARNRFRDLVDLDGLLRHFAQTEPEFWPQLPARARVLGLAEPLALATRFCTHWLGTPVPVATQQQIAGFGPGAVRRRWLEPLLASLLTPIPPDDSAPRLQGLAAGLFLARYHLHRMPLKLLLPHLWHKMRPPRDDVQQPAAALRDEGDAG